MSYEVKVILNLEDNVKNKLERIANSFKELEKILLRIANSLDDVSKSHDRFAKAVNRLNETINKTKKNLASTSKTVKNVADRLKEVAFKTDKATASFQTYNEIINKVKDTSKQVNKTYSQFIENLKEFWDRFGAVATAFTILYRLFNLIEDAISSAIDRIIQGIKYFDEYISAINRYALMLKFAVNTSLSFNQAMKLAVNTINNIRLASLDALTGFQEVITGLDELAQNGIYVSSLLAKPFVDFVDLTVMIAQTTGSTVLQVRQELSALMTGSAKASNQMVRFLKNVGMTDKQIKKLYDKLLSMDNPTKRFAELIIYLNKYISQFKDNLYSLSFDKAINRFSNLINILSSFAVQLVNLSKTGTVFNNVFANIFNNLYEQFLNTNVYKKITQFQSQMYLAIANNNLAQARQLYERITDLQQRLFTSNAKEYISNMAHLYNILADAIKGVVVILSGFIKYLLEVIRYLDIFYQIGKNIVIELLKIPLFNQLVSLLSLINTKLLALATSMFIVYKSTKLAFNAMKIFLILGITRLIPFLKNLRTVLMGIGAVTSMSFMPIMSGMLALGGIITFILNKLGKLDDVVNKLKIFFNKVKNEINKIFGFETFDKQKEFNKLFGVDKFENYIKKFEIQVRNLETIINNFNNSISKYKSLADTLKSLGLNKLTITWGVPTEDSVSIFGIKINRLNLLQKALQLTKKSIDILLQSVSTGKNKFDDIKLSLYEQILQFVKLKKEIILTKLGFDKLVTTINEFKSNLITLNLDN